MAGGRVRREVRTAVAKLVDDEKTPLSLVEKDRLIEEILDEVFGLGPLEPLLQDPTVSDILVTTPRLVYVVWTENSTLALPRSLSVGGGTRPSRRRSVLSRFGVCSFQIVQDHRWCPDSRPCALISRHWLPNSCCSHNQQA
jgi:hypothetical protein